MPKITKPSKFVKVMPKILWPFFLDTVYSNIRPILHHFRDKATYWLKITNFCIYHSLIHSASPLPMFPLKFGGEVNREETINYESWRHSPVKTA